MSADVCILYIWPGTISVNEPLMTVCLFSVVADENPVLLFTFWNFSKSDAFLGSTSVMSVDSGCTYIDIHVHPLGRLTVCSISSVERNSTGASYEPISASGMYVSSLLMMPSGMVSSTMG